MPSVDCFGIVVYVKFVPREKIQHTQELYSGPMHSADCFGIVVYLQLASRKRIQILG